VRLALLAALLLSAAPALAEPLSTYTLTLSAQEVDYLGGLLGKEPLKDAMPLYQKLQSQVREEQEKAAQAKPAPKPNASDLPSR
jgi:hypothetical protein